ncbi:hypothetical protein N8314_03610 [Akkermansiaceae bacterium]|nr:hypothetical protein [Akkermansiaceae bacterium]
MKKIVLLARKFLKALKVFISRVLADGGIIEARKYVNSLLKTVGDASLVLIPSAYKSGVLYNILPQQELGAELVVNGTFDTDTDWTKELDWTISSGLANKSVGTLSRTIKQTNILTIGKTYKCVFTVAKPIDSSIIRLNSSETQNNRQVSGTFLETFTASKVDLDFIASAEFGGSIDNISVVEVVQEVADFTFSRASGATRVNSQGLIEEVSISGAVELVTNGDFSDGITGWTVGGGGSIEIEDVSLKVTNALGGYDWAQSNISTEVGKIYQVVVDLKKGNGDAYCEIIGVSGANTTVVSDTEFVTKTFTFVATSTNHQIKAKVQDANNGFYAYFDNVSVKEVFEEGIPRIDYTDGTPVLLTEPQSTNLLTYSEDFSNDVMWLKSDFTVSSNSGVSPDGNVNADKLISSNGTSSLRGQGTFTFLDNSTNTISVYAKKGIGDFFTIRGAFFDTNFQIGFDLENGTSQVGGEIYDAGNGWYRCSVSWTLSNIDTNGYFYFYSSSTLGGVDGVIGNEFYMWGAQLEALPYATSYIPTSGTTATRLGEIVNNGGDVNTFNSEEGVLFWEGSNVLEDGFKGINISDGTTQNRVGFVYWNTSSIRFRYVKDNVLQSDFYYEELDYSVNLKIAMSWKENNVRIYINGTKVNEDLIATMQPPNTMDTLIFADGSTANNFYGKTKQLQVFKTALTDLELTELTTI